MLTKILCNVIISNLLHASMSEKDGDAVSNDKKFSR